jgi:hypothetical protein
MNWKWEDFKCLRDLNDSDIKTAIKHIEKSFKYFSEVLSKLNENYNEVEEVLNKLL